MLDAAGTFATTLGLVSIRPEEGVLCACLADQPLEVERYPDGSLGLSPGAKGKVPPGLEGLAGSRLTVRRQAGRDVVVAIEDGRETLLGERLEPQPLPPAWAARLGTYRVVNPDPGFPLDGLSLRYEHGVLCMSYRLPALTAQEIRYPLRILHEREAVIAGLGRSRGETVQVVDHDGEELLRFSGFLLRPVTP